MASLVTFPLAELTMAILALAAAAKIGGVLPTAPMSIAPPEAASSSGGPDVNVDHSILYGAFSSPAAVSSAFCDPFWSPPLSTTLVRSSPDVAVLVPHAASANAARSGIALRSSTFTHSQVGQNGGTRVRARGVFADDLAAGQHQQPVG